MDRYQSPLAGGNAALAEFKTLDPNLYEGPAVSELRNANQSLHEMEALAFAVPGRGQKGVAAPLLIGPEYERQKQLGAEATSQISQALSASAESALVFQRRRGRTVVITVAVAVLLLLFTWVISLRISAKLIAQRRQDETERAEQARMAAFVADAREALTNPDSLGSILQRYAGAMVRHLDPVLARIWILDPRDSVLVLSARAGRYTILDERHERVPVGSKYKV